MSALFALAAALSAQIGPPILSDDSITERDVAFEQLANGEIQQAIARLEAARAQNPDDPALLINLGSAYAQAGNREKAAEYYRAAIESDERYRLELADGDWIDSRYAARMALSALEGNELALNSGN